MAITKRNKAVQTAWNLVELENELFNLGDGNLPTGALEHLYGIAETAGLAMVQAVNDEFLGLNLAFDVPDEFGNHSNLYAEEIKTGHYYFIPAQEWRDAVERDKSSHFENDCWNRRMIMMKYATEKTYDAMKEAGF